MTVNIVASLFVSVGCLVLSALSYAATEHDNEVFFDVAGVTAFTFDAKQHSITPGQPYSGVTSNVSRTNAEGRIVVKAGRKGSAGVADWFNKEVGTGTKMVCHSATNSPDNLNFAVSGTLTITAGSDTVTCNNVIIAQGHNTKNNWWLGGPGMVGAVRGGEQRCSSNNRGDAIVRFSPEANCVNKFAVDILKP